MMKIQTKITSQGQVSVPAAIRQILALTPGSSLIWTQDQGRVTVERAVRHSTTDVHQVLFPDASDAMPTETKPKTLAELKQGIRQNMKSRHARN